MTNEGETADFHLFYQLLKFSGILIKRNNQEEGQPQGIAPTGGS
jgi:hypothetical protein